MVIVNKYLPREIIARLEEFTEIIFAPEATTLPKGLSAHPDMLIHSSPKGLICAPEICDELKTCGISVKSGKGNPTEKYPLDIRYNCFHIGSSLICNLRYTDEVILSQYERVIDCKQGYASCSTIRLKGAVITADKNIASACEAASAEVLCISAGGIRLDGYDYGFIGGCGGIVSGRLLFFGNPLAHPDGKRIVEFCTEHGVEVIPLCDGTLTDYGGIIEVK